MIMKKELETPILFVIFNRPETSQQVFDRIKEVRPKQLFVAADGPRANNVNDLISCNQTRKIINQIDWPCQLKTLFRDENIGCGLGVSSSITWFFEHVEYGIILEDDCLPDLSFFNYCQELLIKYKDNKDIFLISGTNMQNGNKRGDGSYFFSYYCITWGWASWRRAWQHFDYEMEDVEESMNNGSLNHFFQSNDEKNYWKGKLAEVQKFRGYIWDYQWFYDIWKNKGVGITPNINLVMNLGFRNNATHSFLHDSIREPLVTDSIRFPLIHPTFKVDSIADKFTYANALSHSPTRLLRLLKENGLLSVIRYSASKITQ